MRNRSGKQIFTADRTTESLLSGGLSAVKIYLADAIMSNSPKFDFGCAESLSASANCEWLAGTVPVDSHSGKQPFLADRTTESLLSGGLSAVKIYLADAIMSNSPKLDFGCKKSLSASANCEWLAGALSAFSS